MLEQMIRQAISRVDALVDARGVQKCALAVQTIEGLNAALDELTKEHQAHDALVEGLRKRIAELSGGDDTEQLGDETYTIGKVGG